MKQKSISKVDQILAEQMRKVSLALTQDQRKANGRKAWQTRRANIAAKISAQ